MTRRRHFGLFGASFAALGFVRIIAACATSDATPPSSLPTTDATAPDDAAPGDEPTVDAHQDPGFDLSHGEWKTLQVSNTPGTIGHDGRIAFLPDGTLLAAWSEPLYDDLANQNIWTAVLPPSALAWTNAKGLTNDTKVQNAFPTLVGVGSVLSLVWNAYPKIDNDLFYTRFEADAWSAPADLTTPYEITDGGLRSDFAATMAVAPVPGGGFVVAYSSEPADDAGGPTASAEIRVIRLDATGAPKGPPEKIFSAPSAGDGCFHATVTVDAAGHTHVAADCGPITNEDIYYATDVSGSWQVTDIPGVGRDDNQPSLALTPDGKTVYLVWAGYLACATTSGKCGEIFFTTSVDGALGPIGSVTNTADENENTPRAVVDRYGRLIVGFQHFNKDNFADVYLTWSNDGANFAPVRNLTPGTDNETDNGPSAFALEPKTGVPHILYEAVLGDSSPLNAEIMHAYFVPDLVR